MPLVKFRGVQIGRLHIMVGLAPRLRKYRGKLPGNWLKPDDRFLGYRSYLGGEPSPLRYPPLPLDEDGGVE
jgi:hypothetical protein